MDCFECDAPPPGDLVCSDNNCPCPEVKIPRASGYIYIEPGLVAFRRKHPRLEDARAAMDKRIRAKFGAASGGMVRLGPILVCEQGARLRKLDLETASADAKHWWKTGQVPLRPTPLADGTIPPVGEDEYLGGDVIWSFGAGGLLGGQSSPESRTTDAKSGCFIATACYGAPDCSEVLFFRRFRDAHMLRCRLGISFVKAYYAVSPGLARLVRRHRLLRYAIRVGFLVPSHFILRVVERFLSVTIGGRRV